MKKRLLFLLVVFWAFTCEAQKALLFVNSQSGEEILIKEGDLLKISYTGYIKQREVKSGVVTLIQDSIIEISSPGEYRKRMPEIRYVYVNDITGFRKFRKSKPALQFVSRVMATAGSIALYYWVDSYTDMNFGQKLALSAGTGIATGVIARSFFPERVKNFIASNGWTVNVLK